jgi:hypothetical protein
MRNCLTTRPLLLSFVRHALGLLLLERATGTSLSRSRCDCMQESAPLLICATESFVMMWPCELGVLAFRCRLLLFLLLRSELSAFRWSKISSGPPTSRCDLCRRLPQSLKFVAVFETTSSSEDVSAPLSPQVLEASAFASNAAASLPIASVTYQYPISGVAYT